MNCAGWCYHFWEFTFVTKPFYGHFPTLDGFFCETFTFIMNPLVELITLNVKVGIGYCFFIQNMDI